MFMKKFYINRFFFTILPPQPVQAFVSDLRNHVRQVIGHGFEDESSPAHMVLFKYTDKSKLLHETELLISALLPLEIQVKGLGVFKHGVNKTIYLQIAYKTPVPDLASVLGGEPVTPHIILARNLNPDDFPKAWERLQGVEGNYFRCNTITVLKREPNQWNKLLKLPVGITQSHDTAICVH
jgi:2'-5' RNA ligase